MFKDFESYRSKDDAQMHKPERDSRNAYIPIEEIEDPDAEDAVYTHVENSLFPKTHSENLAEEELDISGDVDPAEADFVITDSDLNKDHPFKTEEEIRTVPNFYNEYDNLHIQTIENKLAEEENPTLNVDVKDRPINQDRYRHKHTDPNAKPKPTLDRKIQQENSALLRDIADNGGIITQEDPEDFFEHTTQHINSPETDSDTPQNFADVA